MRHLVAAIALLLSACAPQAQPCLTAKRQNTVQLVRDQLATSSAMPGLRR
jgi:hypothetical protein